MHLLTTKFSGLDYTLSNPQSRTIDWSRWELEIMENLVPEAPLITLLLLHYYYNTALGSSLATSRVNLTWSFFS